MDGEARWEDLEIALVGRTANGNGEKGRPGAPKAATRPAGVTAKTRAVMTTGPELTQVLCNLIGVWRLTQRTDRERKVLIQALIWAVRK